MKTAEEFQTDTRKWAFDRLNEVCNRYSCWHLMDNDVPIPPLPRWKLFIISVFNL